jgi:hypothetical protein
MLFRDKMTGDLVVVNRDDYTDRRQYYSEIKKLFGIESKKTNIVEKDNQVDFIYGLLSRKRPSSHNCM